MKVEIRPQQVSDAKRFFAILSNQNFNYFPVDVKTLGEEIEFLRQNAEKRKNKEEFNFSILCDGELIGGIGIRIQKNHAHVGEIGYFVDEKY